MPLYEPWYKETVVSCSTRPLRYRSSRVKAFVLSCGSHKSRCTTKLTKRYVRPAKTQISLGIRPVRSEPSLCALKIAKDPRFLHADSDDSYQTGRMLRLTCLRWAHRSFCWFVVLRLISIVTMSNGYRQRSSHARNVSKHLNGNIKVTRADNHAILIGRTDDAPDCSNLLHKRYKATKIRNYLV